MCDSVKTAKQICLLGLLLTKGSSEDFPPQQEKGTATNPLESHLECSSKILKEQHVFPSCQYFGDHPLPFVSKGPNLFKLPSFPPPTIIFYLPQYQAELLQALTLLNRDEKWKKKRPEEMLIKTKVPDQWHQMIIELLVK